MEQKLKLIALDEEDLGIVSFHLHNAEIAVKDMLRQALASRFLLALRRCPLPAPTAAALETAKQQGGAAAKIPAVLHFERVLSARSFGIDRRQSGQKLALQGLYFHAKQPPSGIIEFLFAEKAGLQLEVECIEARLEDLPLGARKSG